MRNSLRMILLAAASWPNALWQLYEPTRTFLRGSAFWRGRGHLSTPRAAQVFGLAHASPRLRPHCDSSLSGQAWQEASIHVAWHQEMEVQAFEHLVHPLGVETSDLLLKVLLAYGEDLRNVHDALFGQAALARTK
jgi:hypothetical protein